MAPDLIKFGKVLRPGLGVVLAPQQVLSRLNVEGVMIASAPEGSAAAQAGLRGAAQEGNTIRFGDVVTALDGRPVSNRAELQERMKEFEVGQEVEVTYLRDGEEKTVAVRLQAL